MTESTDAKTSSTWRKKIIFRTEKEGIRLDSHLQELNHVFHRGGKK